MTKEEALARGVELDVTKHSMKRRSSMHDYSSRGMYMLTLVVEGRLPLFGVLQGKGGENGNTDCNAWVKLSLLGEEIAKEEVKKIQKVFPQVEVLKLCVMPDHLHLILFVHSDLPNGKHLGQVVAGFKSGCSRAWWKGIPSANALGTQPGSVPCVSAQGAVSAQREKKPIFEKGYNDKLLLRAGQLDNWKHYLDDNPRRLWLKRHNPQFFTTLYDIPLADRKCQIIGNRFLLDIPDKRAVIVHRRYTDEENTRLRQEWLACGERGGVLVSAAIAPKEKEVLREAMDRGYNIILLRENGFPPLYKPSGEAFNACSGGRLLQVSPWEFHMERETITRAQCLELNRMAEAIAEE